MEKVDRGLSGRQTDFVCVKKRSRGGVCFYEWGKVCKDIKLTRMGGGGRGGRSGPEG